MENYTQNKFNIYVNSANNKYYNCCGNNSNMV